MVIIHPSIFICLSKIGSQGSSLSRDTQTSLSLATSSSSSTACLGFSSGPPLGKACLEHLIREAFRPHPSAAISTFGHRPIQIAPYLLGLSYKWWAHGKKDPRCWNQGCRSGHQALAIKPTSRPGSTGGLRWSKVLSHNRRFCEPLFVSSLT